MISTQDIPGWAVTSQDNYTVALDMTITEELFNEGLAREIVNRVQTLRKSSGLEVTDRIHIFIEKNEKIEEAIRLFSSYIGTETLANNIQILDSLEGDGILEDELTEKVYVRMMIKKV